MVSGTPPGCGAGPGAVRAEVNLPRAAGQVETGPGIPGKGKGLCGRGALPAG